MKVKLITLERGSGRSMEHIQNELVTPLHDALHGVTHRYDKQCWRGEIGEIRVGHGDLNVKQFCNRDGMDDYKSTTIPFADLERIKIKIKKHPDRRWSMVTIYAKKFGEDEQAFFID